MRKASHSKPIKRKDAEIIVKRNYGIGFVFSGNLSAHEGLAVFANRRGYRFLSDYFRWLAEREISELDGDPGDHVHLTPESTLSDELDFTFDTLTSTNRDAVLRNARASKRSRRQGSPVKQFKGIVAEMVDFLEESFRVPDKQLCETTIKEINALIDVLKEKKAALQRMKTKG